MQDYLDFIYDLNDPDLISVYDELPLWSAPFGLTLLDEIPYFDQMKVLDIGCGTGFPLIEIAQRIFPTGHITGIEPWKEAHNRIQLKIKTQKIKNVSLINGIAEQLPFPDQYFNLIVSNNGLNNVKDLHQALKESYRVLKSGSLLVFTFNLPDTMIEFYNLFSEVLNEMNLKEELWKMKKHIEEKRKTINQMKFFLKQSHFKVLKIKKRHFSLKFLNAASFFNHHFIQLGFLPSWKALLNPNQVKEVFQSLENKLKQYSLSKGYLNLTIPFACFVCKK